MDEFLLQVMRLALPLILAALAETICERGGVVNLGIEGMMLAGAFVAYVVAAGETPWLLGPAWIAAAVTGVFLSAIVAWFTVHRRADQIVTGSAIHFLCLGGTGLLFERFKGHLGVTTFHELPGWLPAIPYLITLALVAATTVLLSSTAWGLRIRAAGDGPMALRTMGGSAVRARWLALILAGALCGLAGATLTTVLTGEFVEGMTAGRGFLALSLVLFARWHPVGSLIAGLFLGASFAMELHLSTWAVQKDHRNLLVFLVRVSPYLLTIGALALVRPQTLRAPAALGQPLPD